MNRTFMPKKNHNIQFLAYLLAIGVTFIVGGVIVMAERNEECQASYNRMSATNKCIETPGCLYVAEDLFKGKQAAVHYDKSCQEYDIRRQLQE